MKATANAEQDREESLVRGNVIEALYAMMLEEISHTQYSEREIALFKDPIHYYGRYLNPITRLYAICNFVSSISAAIAYLKLGGAGQKRVVDLGCGLGMQSIIFASLGAEVLGIDLDAECITICRKRYFEARLGRGLKMEFLQANFRTLDPDSMAEDSMRSLACQPLHISDH